MKKVYFVRHAESEWNVKSVRQVGSAPITEKGQDQASLVGERFKDTPIDVVITSTMTRAKETAEIISEKIQKPLDLSDLFVERRRPDEQYGVKKDDPKANEAEMAIRENFGVPGYRFSNEENFDDLKERVKKLFEYLDSKPEENILVITHGFFIRIIMAYVAHGDKLTSEEGAQFIRTFHMNNTGVTIIRKNEGDNNSTWDLITWNDDSHLTKKR